MDAKANNNTLDVDAQTTVDGLGRSRFTRYLLDVLTQVNAGQGAVVGLEGEWGSGKTWVLRQLEPLAEAHAPGQRLLFLHFNPWMVSGAHDLVAAMLGQLSKQLAEQGRKSEAGSGKRFLIKAVKAIDKYAGALTAVKHAAPAFNLLLPGAGFVVDAIAAATETAGEVARKVAPTLPEAAAKKSLPALRDEICNALKAFDRKIVVVIDDLDRITPAEIAAMVQAVKAVADFPNVVYLMAYERETLVNALVEALRVKDGRAYLEKIIQLPIPLPELPARRKLPHAVNRLMLALPPNWQSLPESHDVRKAIELAVAMLPTPREVERLRARLSVVLKELVGEVNLADVIVAEGIALRVQEWLPWMRAHGRRFIKAGIAQYDGTQTALAMHDFDYSTLGMSDEQRQERDKAQLNALHQLCPADAFSRTAADTYRRALRFLFGDLESIRVHGEPRVNSKRMTLHRHWYRWLCLTDQQEPMSLQELQRYGRDPQQARDGGWLKSVEAIEELCNHFNDLHEQDLTDVDASGWTNAFVQAEIELGRFVLRGDGFGYGVFSALRRLIAAQPDGLKRQQAIAALLERGSLDFGASFLLREFRGDGRSAMLVEDDWLRQQATTWFARLKAALPLWCEHGSDESDYSPLTLLNWVAGRPIVWHEAHDAAKGSLALPNSRLSHFFGTVWSGGEDRHPAGLSIPWGLLSPADELKNRIEQREPDFKDSHSLVWRLICKEADIAGGSDEAKAAIQRVTMSRQSAESSTPPPALDPA
jgi:KAP family P-loop domain